MSITDEGYSRNASSAVKCNTAIWKLSE